MKYAIGTVMSTLFALSAIVAPAPARASVVIEGTRVIFPGQEREVTIKLDNNGKHPALVQAWLDDGDASASPESIAVPFVITPAMFRLDPGTAQTLRMMHTGQAMAQNKESLYWLNVLEVPPRSQASGNKLQLAMRTRIKVMYRPPGLAGEAGQAPAKVRWELIADSAGHALKGSNPSPYFVNLGNVELQVGAQVIGAGNGYIAPGESQLFRLAGAVPAGQAQVRYSAVNDWGVSSAGTQALTSSTD